jgi:hypothetical protein
MIAPTTCAEKAQGDPSTAHPRSGSWIVAGYFPVSLFSLRMTHATSKGGKTLTVPTPYAVKLALIDACFRRYNSDEAVDMAQHAFDVVKAREVRLKPPRHCIVQNTFIRVLDQSRTSDEEQPFKRTIVYREFAWYSCLSDDDSDRMTVGIASSGLSPGDRDFLMGLLAHINHFGKRGGFFQFEKATVYENGLPPGFTRIREDALFSELAQQFGLTHALDDFGEALFTTIGGFDRISTYGKDRITLGKERVLRLTGIPYQRHLAGRGFTWYKRAL